MKRKVNSPDIQQKRRQHVLEKDQEKDLKHELQEGSSLISKKIPQKKVRRGHK